MGSFAFVRGKNGGCKTGGECRLRMRVGLRGSRTQMSLRYLSIWMQAGS